MYDMVRNRSEENNYWPFEYAHDVFPELYDRFRLLHAFTASTLCIFRVKIEWLNPILD